MAILKGIITALAASYLVGLLFACVFRLPIPFVGYIGPLGEVGSHTTNFGDLLQAVAAAWLTYGTLGGFAVLALAGGLAGYLAGRRHAGKPTANRRIVGAAAIASAVPVAVLSVLDWIIGPW